MRKLTAEFKAISTLVMLLTYLINSSLNAELLLTMRKLVLPIRRSLEAVTRTDCPDWPTAATLIRKPRSGSWQTMKTDTTTTNIRVMFSRCRLELRCLNITIGLLLSRPEVVEGGSIFWCRFLVACSARMRKKLSTRRMTRGPTVLKSKLAAVL